MGLRLKEAKGITDDILAGRARDVVVVANLAYVHATALRLLGARVEVVPQAACVRGKGRKERVLTLWKAVADGVRAWLAVRGDAKAPELFVNAHGQALTRSGAQYILGKHVASASHTCRTLVDKRVSPHVLRHTCAMATLRATRDVRKVALWLGHASTQTTEVYFSQDPVDKLETLEAVVPPSLRSGTFSPPDKLIASPRRQ